MQVRDPACQHVFIACMRECGGCMGAGEGALCVDRRVCMCVCMPLRMHAGTRQHTAPAQHSATQQLSSVGVRAIVRCPLAGWSLRGCTA